MTIKNRKKGRPPQNLLPQRPRGTRDLTSEDALALGGFFEKAADTAIYYGFKLIDIPMIEEARLYTSGIGEETDIVEKEMYIIKGTPLLALRPEATAGIMRAYIENGMQSLPQPVMLYTFGSFFRRERPQKGRYREFHQFDLEIVGSPKSIADAIIIQTTINILKDIGFKNLAVEINSIGDKTCRGDFKKALISYYKKFLREICKDCARRLKTNPLRVLDCKEPQCQEIKKAAPTSTSFLCQECKQHFKEVLEYLESLGIEYTINNSLVRGLDYYTKTVFEIVGGGRSGETEEGGDAKPLALAGGGRYDGLSKLIGSKKNIPAVGVGLGVDRIVEMIDSNTLKPRIIKKPKIFFIQLGFDAKLQSLKVIEVFRKAKVPILHSLGKDNLSAQLNMAEKMAVPYAAILGQREVLDGTVIIRQMDSHSQDIIKLDKLLDYLKKNIK